MGTLLIRSLRGTTLLQGGVHERSVDAEAPPTCTARLGSGGLRLSSAEAAITSASIGSRVGILPELLEDLTSPLGIE